MALSWLVGLHLAMSLGWFAMNWIWVKIGIAAVLSALLGIQSAALGRMRGGAGAAGAGCMRRSRLLRRGAVGLAVVKPLRASGASAPQSAMGRHMRPRHMETPV